MREDFLHHLWKFKLFDQRSLITADGEALEVIRAGDHNHDSGPDFFNAKIKLGGMMWVGNVEIHVLASDWERHLHQFDASYDNVILHVVFKNDVPVKRKNGECIPALELKNRIDLDAYEKYLRMYKSKEEVPCGKQISEVDEFSLNNWLDRVLTERLESKTLAIQERLAQNKNDQALTFYQFLGRNFGFKINNEPFELLTRSLPMNIIAKHKHDRFQLEALLFGQAGMLSFGKLKRTSFEDEYPLRLKKEYEFLKHKYSLCPLDAHIWKFSRMMPGNFPSIRISQFADLISRSSHLFSKILEATTLRDLENMLQAKASWYWNDHYVFDKLSSQKKKSLGTGSIFILIINCIVPFLFLYGKARGEEEYVDRAFVLLEEMKGERNRVIFNWEKLGVEAGTAYRSQALLQLKKEYCDKKRCLNCGVGVKLLSNQKDPQKI